MSAMIEMLRALVGLFVDDEWLAVGVLGVVGLTALSVNVFGARPLVASGMLLGGNILVLVMGVLRTARLSVRRDETPVRGKP